jgi:hypothetical protein
MQILRGELARQHLHEVDVVIGHFIPHIAELGELQTGYGGVGEEKVDSGLPRKVGEQHGEEAENPVDDVFVLALAEYLEESIEKFDLAGEAEWAAFYSKMSLPF